MGYIKHNAIIVTSWSPTKIEKAYQKAVEIGMSVSYLIVSKINGYFSFLIGPDGGKALGEEDITGDDQRNKMRAWLLNEQNDDGSSSLEWIEVAYGSDVPSAAIVIDGNRLGSRHSKNKENHAG